MMMQFWAHKNSWEMRLPKKLQGGWIGNMNFGQGSRAKHWLGVGKTTSPSQRECSSCHITRCHLVGQCLGDVESESLQPLRWCDPATMRRPPLGEQEQVKLGKRKQAALCLNDLMVLQGVVSGPQDSNKMEKLFCLLTVHSLPAVVVVWAQSHQWSRRRHSWDTKGHCCVSIFQKLSASSGELRVERIALQMIMGMGGLCPMMHLISNVIITEKELSL